MEEVKKEVVLEVDTERAETSVKEIRKEIKRLQDEMANLEEGSDAFLEVAAAAGELKHKIDEIKDSTNGASADFGDLMQAGAKTTAGLVGAFQSVKGAMTLMGVESETVEKAIEKMQASMAIIQGIQAIDDGIKGFKKLTTAINVATRGMSGFKKALIGTGIGAIVVLIGELIAHFDDLDKLTGGKLSKTLSGLGGVLGNLGNEVKAIGKLLLNSLLLPIKNAIEAVKGLGKIIKAVFSGEWDSIGDIAKETASNIKDQFAEVGESAKEVGHEFAKGFTDGVAADETKKAQEAWEEWAKKQNENLDIAASKAKALSEDEVELNKKLLSIEKQRLATKKSGTKEYYEQLFKIKDLENKITKSIKEQTKAKKDANDARSAAALAEYESTANRDIERAGIGKTDFKYSPEGVAMMLNYYKQEKEQIELLETDEDKRKEKLEKLETNRLKYLSDLQKYNEKARISTEERTDAEYTQDLLSLQARFTNYDDYVKEKEKLDNEYAKKKLDNLKVELQTENNELDIAKLQLQEIQSEEGVTQEKIDAQQAIIDEIERRIANTQSAIASQQESIMSSGSTEIITITDRFAASLDIMQNTLSLLGSNSAWSGVVTQISNIASMWDELSVKFQKGGEDATSAALVMASAGLSAIGSIFNGLADEQDASNEEGFEQQKKLQIAGATMNMLAGITAALSGAFTTHTGVWDLILAGVQSAGIAAAGAVQIAKIKKMTYDGSNSTTSSASSGGYSLSNAALQSMLTPSTSSSMITGYGVDTDLESQRVYVVESDITSSQNKVSVTESEATY